MNDSEKDSCKDSSSGDTFDFTDFENKLESRLRESLKDYSSLQNDYKEISSPDSLGKAVMNVVWDQFIIQVGAVAGEDFIKENRGLTLDLRDEAHIQSVENFEKQKYAKHNTYVNYEKRGVKYRSHLFTDPNKRPPAPRNQKQRYNERTKNWEYYDTTDDTWHKSIRNDARKPYDDYRSQFPEKVGNKTIHKDHQKPVAEHIRDPEMSTYLSEDEKIKLANSDSNLYDLDCSANQSKLDHDGEKWIKKIRDSENGNGQTNAEYFGIDEEKFLEQDRKAKENAKKEIEKKKKEEIALGRKSQREEAFRIGGKALRSAIMVLLAELIRNIISKLVVWIKSNERNIYSFWEQMKSALSSFFSNLKQIFINSATSFVSTILTSIGKPIFNAILRVWNFIKQAGRSLKDAFAYIKNPENRKKSFSIFMLELSKIIIAGIASAGALALSQIIENSLMGIPGFAIEIPFLGSLASIIGIFLGAVISGIAGAIFLYLIDNIISKKLKNEIIAKQIDKGNEVLSIQSEIITVNTEKYKDEKQEIIKDIYQQHSESSKIIKHKISNIFSTNDSIKTKNEGAKRKLFDDLDKL